MIEFILLNKYNLISLKSDIRPTFYEFPQNADNFMKIHKKTAY
jgi:hypothetical protein